MEFRFYCRYTNGNTMNGGLHICPNLDEAIDKAKKTIHTHNQANAIKMYSIEVWHKGGMDKVTVITTGKIREIT